MYKIMPDILRLQNKKSSEYNPIIVYVNVLLTDTKVAGEVAYYKFLGSDFAADFEDHEYHETLSIEEIYFGAVDSIEYRYMTEDEKLLDSIK